MSVSCRATLLGTIVLVTLQLDAAETVAQAQESSEKPVTVELLVSGNEVRCAPSKIRLPIAEIVELRFINSSAQPIVFVAPDFFDAATILESSEFTSLPSTGEFVTGPGSVARISVRTPSADEYGYSCHLPNELPTPAASGFLVVGPIDAETVDIPPLLRDEDDQPAAADESE